MPLRIRERPPQVYSVVKPRTQGSKAQSGSMTAKPEMKSYLNKKTKQTSADVGSHAQFKAPSHESHHQTVGETDAFTQNKSYADHFFQIKKGHNRGTVTPHYNHKQMIDASQYFPRPI